VTRGDVDPFAVAPPPSTLMLENGGGGNLVSRLAHRLMIGGSGGGGEAVDDVPFAATSSGVCRNNVSCGGDAYCQHAHMDAGMARALLSGNDASVRRAVHAWVRYDVPPPYAAAARAPLDRLLRTGASPHVLQRCGATAEYLALAGFTLRDLLRPAAAAAARPLSEWLDGLELDWQRLQTLRFHADDLRHHEAVPVLDLMQAPSVLLSASHLMQFPVTADYLTRSLRLSTSELAALGFDVPLLVHLGLSGQQLVGMLLADSADGGDLQRTARWYARYLRLTPGMLAHLAVTLPAPLSKSSPSEQRAWSALYAAVVAKKTP